MHCESCCTLDHAGLSARRGGGRQVLRGGWGSSSARGNPVHANTMLQRANPALAIEARELHFSVEESHDVSSLSVRQECVVDDVWT